MSAIAPSPREKRKPRGCVLRALGFYALFLLCTVGVWIVGGHTYTSRQIRAENRAWSETGLSMESLLTKYPRSDDSQAARDLDRLTRRIGIRLLRAEPVGDPVDEMDLYKVNNKYVGQISRATDDRIVPLPSMTRAYLIQHRSTLDEIANYLVTTDGITWEMDLGRGIDAPLPSLLAHRHLHALLLVAAIERQGRGDVVGARRFLEAAWRHVETLAPRPELIGQLIAVGLMGNQNALLRSLPDVGPEWSGRLAKHEYRKTIVASWQIDAYGWLAFTKDYRGAADYESPPPYGLFKGGPTDCIIRLLSVPFLRFEMANMSRFLRRGRALALANDQCLKSGEDLARQVAGEMRRWNVIARVGVPSLFRSWSSGVMADFDAELTILVLAARERQRQSGSWGEETSVPSKICSGAVWRHRTDQDGNLTITADSAPEFNLGAPRQWTYAVSRRQNHR